MSCALRTGKYGKIMWMGSSVESQSGLVLKVTVQEQQGRQVNHQNGEGEMERDDTCAMEPFQALEPCVCVHAHEDVRMCADSFVQQKNVRATL